MGRVNESGDGRSPLFDSGDNWGPYAGGNQAGFGSWEGDGFGGGPDQHGSNNVSDHGDGPQ